MNRTRRKRLICRVFGHDPVPVTKMTLASGEVRFFPNPHGTRRGCHRCKTVRRSN